MLRYGASRGYAVAPVLGCDLDADMTFIQFDGRTAEVDPPEVEGFERIGDALGRILPTILNGAPLRDLPALAAVSCAGLAFLTLIIGVR